MKNIRAMTVVHAGLLGVFCLGAAMIWFGISSSAGATTPEGGTATMPGDVTFIDDPSQLDFSRFKHTNEAHTRMPCLLCHRRDDNSARMRMPGNINHEPCAGCHQAQFKDASSGICTICHTNGAAGGPIRALPGLQDFTSKFDHASHVRQTNCATCHATNRGGRGFSVPSGANAHVTCFACHTNQSAPASCDTCHVGGRPVRNDDNAKAYSVNFSHTAHIRGARLNCTSCHSVLAGTVKGRQVTAPVAAEHFAPAGTTSCATCHNNKRAFGPPDFADCKRCHTGKTFKF